MRAILTALCFVLLAGLCTSSAYAFRSGEHLELLSVEESIDDYGLAVFSGTVQNTSATQSVMLHVHVILKKDGVIVARYLGRISFEFLNGLGPGRSTDFSVKTDYEPGDYDEFYVSLKGYPADIDLDMVEGDLDIVEGSVGLTTSVYLLVEYTVLYGELVNNTNAVVTDITVEFDLLDGRDNLIGIASTRSFVEFLQFFELGPGESVDFAALVPRASESRVKGWEPRVSFRAIELVGLDIPTAITETTWGQIKNHSRAENAE